MRVSNQNNKTTQKKTHSEIILRFTKAAQAVVKSMVKLDLMHSNITTELRLLHLKMLYYWYESHKQTYQNYIIEKSFSKSE